MRPMRLPYLERSTDGSGRDYLWSGTGFRKRPLPMNSQSRLLGRVDEFCDG
jgi:hypothetical protein